MKYRKRFEFCDDHEKKMWWEGRGGGVSVGDKMWRKGRGEVRKGVRGETESCGSSKFLTLGTIMRLFFIWAELSWHWWIADSALHDLDDNSNPKFAREKDNGISLMRNDALRRGVCFHVNGRRIYVIYIMRYVLCNLMWLRELDLHVYHMHTIY